MRSQVIIGKKTFQIELFPQANGRVKVALEGRELLVDVEVLPGGSYSLLLDGKHFEIDADVNAEGVVLERRGSRAWAEIIDPRAQVAGGRRGAGTGPVVLKSPMPGKVIKLMARVGELVQAGSGLVVIEAMKMQNELKAPITGTLTEIFAQEGASVETNGKLLKLEPVAAPEK